MLFFYDRRNFAEEALIIAAWPVIVEWTAYNTRFFIRSTRKSTRKFSQRYLKSNANYICLCVVRVYHSFDD